MSDATEPNGGTGTEATDQDGDDSVPAVSNMHSLWVRWTTVRPDRLRNNVDDLPVPLIDVHLHRFCDLFPSSTQADLDEVSFRFLDGHFRTVLRYTPLFVFVTVVGLLGYAEVSPTMDGISALVPSLSPWVPQVLAGAVVVWGVLVTLAGRVGLVSPTELLKALVVWGLVLALLVGSLYSASLVLSASDPTGLDDNVVYLSGYLLMLLLGGLVVYDGMLRTETLLDTLPEGNASVVKDGDAYREWKEELQARLDDCVKGMPTSHVAAVVFVSQFAAIWLAQSGPQNLGSPVTLAVNLAADVVLVVVAFRFLVLVKYLNMLMTDQYAPEDRGPTRILSYQPFHYDRRGGFQDFGRFATRVNLLLLLAGLYSVYRLYVQGLRVLPTDGLLAFQSNLDLLLWVGNFVLPVVAYALATGAWVYYSFWAIHRKMMMDKRALSSRHQGVRATSEQMPTTGDSVEDFEEGIDWYYLETAPEWPINSRYITSLVSANAVPLLLPLVRLLG
jgi:hypothetical protein